MESQNKNFVSGGIIMKQFKDLKVGDVIVELDYNIEHTITRIDSRDNSSLNSGFRRFYYGEGISVRCILVRNEEGYCEDLGDFNNPNFVTPKENLTIFQEVYKAGIRKGEMDFKQQVLNLFRID